MFDPDKINLWTASDKELAAWDEHHARQRAIKEASPEFQKRKRNTRMLSEILAQMLYPPGPYCFMGAQEKHGRLEYDLEKTRDMSKGEYPHNKDEVIFRAFERYFDPHRPNTNNCSYEAVQNRLSELDPYTEQLILEANEAAKWPYKLGAALYLHQQMVVRKKGKEPSQGKAQWLVAKAPVSQVKHEGKINLRPNGGEAARIGDQWKKYFNVADYWAAFVVWAKTPLDYPTDKFPLIAFIENADPDEFFTHAAAFEKFRSDVPVTRTIITPLIKQGLGRGRRINEIVPAPQLSIPDLLLPHQWAALQEYKTRLRKERKKPTT